MQSYIKFVQMNETKCFAEVCFAGVASAELIEATTKWLKKSGAKHIQSGESHARCPFRGMDKFHKSTYVTFWHESHDFYKELAARRPNPTWSPLFEVPAPRSESACIQSKHLYRHIVRPLTNQNSTPVELDSTHLQGLRYALSNLSEFTRKGQQEGNFYIGSIREGLLEEPLKQLIDKIERLGYCAVID